MFANHTESAASFCDYMPVHAASDILPGPVFLEAGIASTTGDFLRITNVFNAAFVGMADTPIAAGQTSSIAVNGVVLVESQTSGMKTHDLFCLSDFPQAPTSDREDARIIVGSVINKHDSIFDATGEKHVYRISLLPWINHATMTVDLSPEALSSAAEKLLTAATTNSDGDAFKKTAIEILKASCTSRAIPKSW